MKNYMSKRSKSLTYEEHCLGHKIVKLITECFKDPANRKAFEEWHLKEYGVPYVWQRYVFDSEGNVIGSEPIPQIKEKTPDVSASSV